MLADLLLNAFRFYVQFDVISENRTLLASSSQIALIVLFIIPQSAPKFHHKKTPHPKVKRRNPCLLYKLKDSFAHNHENHTILLSQKQRPLAWSARSYQRLLCLQGINDFFHDNLFGSTTNTVHPAHPYHGLLCLELLRDALLPNHLRYQAVKHPYRSFVCIGEMPT